MEKIVIERTDSAQQFHVWVRAGNSERTFWCENLKTRASAEKALVSLARLFHPGARQINVVRDGPYGYALHIDADPFMYLSIQYVDKRAPKKA